MQSHYIRYERNACEKCHSRLCVPFSPTDILSNIFVKSRLKDSNTYDRLIYDGNAVTAFSLHGIFQKHNHTEGEKQTNWVEEKCSRKNVLDISCNHFNETGMNVSKEAAFGFIWFISPLTLPKMSVSRSIGNHLMNSKCAIC